MSEPSALYNDSTQLQKISGVVAFIFGSAAMIMTAYWAHGPNEADGYLGGLNMNKQIFNWHPVLMVTGFVFCFVSSLLTYRLLPVPKAMQKTLHVLSHTAAVVCMSVGLAAVLTSSNNKDKNTYDSYSPNFYTIHSFVGIAVICLYGLNFLLGIFHYLLPGVDIALKQSFMPSHVFLGTFLLFAALAAVESGFMLVTSGCYYQPTKADLNPAEKYHLIPEGCRLANDAGIACLIAVFFCFYAIFRFGAGKEGRGGKDAAEDG
jgi:hypothetical protein